MPLQPRFDPSDLGPQERRERLPGAEEKRELTRSWRVADGTLACPSCDLPVTPPSPGLVLTDEVSCPYCDHVAPARDFLSLTDAPRPARVHVIATLSGIDVERGQGDRAEGGRAGGERADERASAPR